MAAVVGQLIYNLQGVGTSNDLTKYILAASTGANGDPLVPGSNANAKPLLNHIAAGGKIKLTKLGIQAEPGVTAMINGTPIVVGRSGIYELDNDNIAITNLYLIPKKIYRKNEAKTLECQSTAVNKFAEVSIQPYSPNDDPNTPKVEGWDPEKLSEWIQNYKNTDVTFKEGYINYLKGYTGVYEFNDNYEEFHNLIIDYVYEVDG